MKIFLSIFSALALVLNALATTYASNGTQADFDTKYASASSGDTITIATGTHTGWGASNHQSTINKSSLHIVGLGTCAISLAADGPSSTSGVLNVTANNVSIENLTINGIIHVGGSDPSTTPISLNNVTGIRIENVIYNGPAAPGYFVYCGNAEGVAALCTVNGGNGSLQTFMIRGPGSVWNSPHTMGTVHNFFIEDCTIAGTGYANENDGAACSVIRFNTINDQAYLDAHMIETATDISNTPHGSRQLEAYRNTYTFIGQTYNLTTFAGGTGMIFENTVPDNGDQSVFSQILEYGANAGSATYLGTWTTPAMSPIPDQPGMGPYPQVAGAEPVYYFHNRHASGTNLLLNGAAVSAGALAQFGSAFVMVSADGSPYMLREGRDYIQGNGGSFPSATAIGYGTQAQMLSSSPTLAGQCWWVTNLGNWNSKVAPNTVGQGQLWKWNGAAWVFFYQPYTYPHPLRVSAGSSAQGTVKLQGTIQIR